jgi:phenylacetic acid degradation operon negative regulatory protein
MASDDVTSAANPRRLILSLLLAAQGEPLSAREAVVACDLFGIRENAARVTLARLSTAGLVENAERGSYRLTASASGFATEIGSWRDAEKRLRKWTGQYVAVHCGALARADRSALRRRDRALRLVGLRELEPGLALRPDNLEGGVDGARRRLRSLGLDEEATVFVAGGFDAEREASVRALWDGRALSTGYSRTRAELERWLAQAGKLSPDVAARESFLVGDRAIRQLVFDPLLPEPLVDGEARRAFVDTLRRFDSAGQSIWRTFYRAVAREANEAAAQ